MNKTQVDIILEKNKYIISIHYKPAFGSVYTFYSVLASTFKTSIISTFLHRTFYLFIYLFIFFDLL